MKFLKSVNLFTDFVIKDIKKCSHNFIDNLSPLKSFLKIP